MPLTARTVVKMREEGETVTVWETVNVWVGYGAIGEGNSNPLQYSCLGNPMDRRDWWATAHEGCKELNMTGHLSAWSKTWPFFLKTAITY